VVKKYQPIFEGTDSATNKANQTKMKDEFEMYMTAKSNFAKKSVEAKQGYQTYSMINEAIPSVMTLLGDNKLTTATLSGLKPSSQQDAVALQVMSQLLQNPDMVGKGQKKFYLTMKN